MKKIIVRLALTFALFCFAIWVLKELRISFCCICWMLMCEWKLIEKIERFRENEFRKLKFLYIFFYYYYGMCANPNTEIYICWCWRVFCFSLLSNHFGRTRPIPSSTLRINLNAKEIILMTIFSSFLRFFLYSWTWWITIIEYELLSNEVRRVSCLPWTTWNQRI